MATPHSKKVLSLGAMVVGAGVVGNALVDCAVVVWGALVVSSIGN